MTDWDLPGGPGVKTPLPSAGGEGSVPGWGAKIPHVFWPKSQNKNRSNFVTNSITTLKMVHIKTKKNLKKNEFSPNILL